ncbi:MAG: hypothetical protein IJ174_06525 [Clostridia bacterium]|nr:hypothetical protein [Clostridia bacterium]
MKTNTVRLQLFGDFIVHAGDMYDALPAKSRKGVSLITYLILQNGRSILPRRLIRELWGNTVSVNPESALKTLVSRTRSLLREIDGRLGACIASDAGGYRWQAQDGVTADVTDFLASLRLAKSAPSDAEKEGLLKEAIATYQGDLFQTGDMVDGTLYVNQLHHAYLEAVYAYVELLKKREAYSEIVSVCRAANRVDDLDDHVHLEMMKALVSLNQRDKALEEYRILARRTKKAIGEEPGGDLQAYYRQLTRAGETVKFNMDVIRNELQAEDQDRSGPFVCDYRAFKEIYNIQLRNLERLSATMFLAVIMLGDPEKQMNTVRQESGMAALMEILKTNLRRGDIVTRFSANTVAMLLPTVSYATGNMVMERVEKLFFEQYPSTDIAFHFRLSPMSIQSL